MFGFNYEASPYLAHSLGKKHFKHKTGYLIGNRIFSRRNFNLQFTKLYKEKLIFVSGCTLEGVMLKHFKHLNTIFLVKTISSAKDQEFQILAPNSKTVHRSSSHSSQTIDQLILI